MVHKKENKLHEQFAVLKNVYDRYGVNFTLKGITRTVNPSWATDSSYENEVAMKGALRKGDYDALNVFFVKELNGFNGVCLSNELALTMLEPNLS